MLSQSFSIRCHLLLKNCTHFTDMVNLGCGVGKALHPVHTPHHPHGPFHRKPLFRLLGFQTVDQIASHIFACLVRKYSFTSQLLVVVAEKPVNQTRLVINLKVLPHSQSPLKVNSNPFLIGSCQNLKLLQTPATTGLDAAAHFQLPQLPLTYCQSLESGAHRCRQTQHHPKHHHLTLSSGEIQSVVYLFLSVPCPEGNFTNPFADIYLHDRLRTVNQD